MHCEVNICVTILTIHNVLNALFFFSNTNVGEFESLWDDCDESLFNEICDVDEMEKIDKKSMLQVNQDVETNDVNLLCENTESTTKRKYCAIESDEPIESKIKECRKSMITKLKNNSLFKF